MTPGRLTKNKRSVFFKGAAESRPALLRIRYQRLTRANTPALVNRWYLLKVELLADRDLSGKMTENAAENEENLQKLKNQKGISENA